MQKLILVLRDRTNIQIIFVLLSLCFGLLFIAKVPLLWGTDETFHAMRIYQLTEGHLRSQNLGQTRQQGGYGGQVPVPLVELVQYVNADQFNNDPSSIPYGTKNLDNPQAYKELGGIRLWGVPTKSYAFPNTAAYSPAPYLPYIAGMHIAKLMNASIHRTVLLMRLAGLLAYIIIIYYALRLLRQSQFKWIIFTIALLPMSVFQAAIISVDSLTIAMCILLTAMVARYFTADFKITRAQIAILFVCAIALPLMKPGYILLGLLPLFLSTKIFATKRVAYGFKAALAASVLLMFAGWGIATKDVASSIALIKPINPGYQHELIDVSQQVHFVVSHPVSYARTVIRNSILNDNRYFTEMFGTLGFNIVTVPGAVIVLEILALLIAVASVGITKLSNKGWILLLSVVGCWLLIITTLYVSYSSVGAPEISGIQGRYFLPLLPAAMCGLAMIFKGRLSLQDSLKSQKSNYLVGFSLTCIVILALSASVIKYLYITGS